MYLEFQPGAAAKDDNFAPTEDNNVLRFLADGNERSCGWTKYVPQAIRILTTKTIRLYFVDEGAGAGIARFDFEWFSVNSAGAIAATGTNTTLVTVPNVAGTIFSVDLDASSWITSITELFFLRMQRDSAAAGDTFAHEIRFAVARTL